jgi:hypothetical protein
MYIRNYGIMGTTKTSKTPSVPGDFAVLHEKALGSQVWCCLVTSNQSEIFELLKLRLSSHRNVSFAQRRSPVMRRSTATCRVAFPMVGTDVTPPTRPWKTARHPSLSNFGDRDLPCYSFYSAVSFSSCDSTHWSPHRHTTLGLTSPPLWLQQLPSTSAV